MTIALGPITITYYSLAIALGVLVGYFLVLKRRKIYNVSKDNIETLAILLIPASIIGARFYHVAAEWDYYSDNPDKILSLQMTGLGLFGVLLFTIPLVTVYAKFKKISALNLLNLGAPALLLGQVVGRLGNYFNHELYGWPTDLPWKIFVPLENRVRGFEHVEHFHPTFLYEMIWNLIGMGSILWLEKKHRPPLSLIDGGESDKKSRDILFPFYLAWYGIGRFLIGFVRIEPDDVWIFNDGQLMAIIMVFIGIGLLFPQRRVGLKG